MKKYSYLVMVVLIFALILSGCAEKADPIKNPTETPTGNTKPIELPPTENILSIEIAGGYEDTIVKDKEIIKAFMEKVSQAKPTSKQAGQDVPDVLQYKRVDLVVEGDISSIFIYEEDSKWYIEQANHGVYETDETTLKLLKDN